MKKLEFWYNPESPTGKMGDVLKELKEIERDVGINIRYVDATEMTENERETFYMEKIVPFAMKEKVRVSYPLRGESRDYDFGVKRPMLLVWKNDELRDIYPHRKLEEVHENPLIDKGYQPYSILDYLESLEEV